MDKKRSFIMGQQVMVTTIVLKLVSLSRLDISVIPQVINSLLNTGHAKTYGVDPVSLRHHVLKIENVSNMAKKTYKCNCGKTTTCTGKDATKIVYPKKDKK
jgi:hypothetical protein